MSKDAPEDFEDLAQEPEKDRHKVTYHFNKKTGQYEVRVQGPDAYDAEGEEVRVTTKSGEAKVERLKRLVGRFRDDRDFPDHKATGELVGLYEIEQREPEPKARKKFKQ